VSLGENEQELRLPVVKGRSARAGFRVVRESTAAVEASGAATEAARALRPYILIIDGDTGDISWTGGAVPRRRWASTAAYPGPSDAPTLESEGESATM
jgi:hypothetical protein